MKVLHIITFMDPKLGGVCQAVRTMAAGLQSLGVVNEIVSLDPPDASFLSGDSLTIHPIGPAKGPWAYSAQLYPWLLENLPGFDVAIVHGLWQYHSHAVSKAIKSLKTVGDSSASAPKLFVMPHGMLDPYFQRAKNRRIKALRNWFYWKLIEAKVINESLGLLFTCEEERNLAREPFSPYHPAKELVVGLGVDDPPTRQELILKGATEINDKNDSSRYILFLSRIHEKKGVDLLIEAHKGLIHDLGASANRPLVVAGPGTETLYGKRMLDLVANDPLLRSTISFPGMLSGDRKWATFYNSDAFILPSHQENFGIAVVEAMACGKPVLISNQVNIWREIEGAGAGIVAADNLEGTKSLLRQWNKMSKDEKASMGKRARTLYETNFAVNSAAGRLLKVIQSE